MTLHTNASHRRVTLLAVLLSCTLLAGCKVGPDYHKPDAKLPENWLSAQADSKAALEQHWWRYLNDPVLDQLIAKAASGNLDIQIAEARISEARATRSSARADLLPTVNTEANAERQGNRLAFGNAPFDLAKPFNTFQAGFDASWELDLFGGRRRAVESAGAELQAAVASRDDMRVSMLAEVARTYVDIRKFQAQLALANEIVQSDTDTLRIAQERFHSGTVPGLDATQAQAQLAQAQAQLPYYQSQLAQAEFSMDVLLGEQPGYAHQLVAAEKPIPTAGKELVLTAPAVVIANRPDIRVAERKLASATAEQGVATAQLFPDVSLAGFFGILTPDAGSILKGDNKSWDAVGGFTWPILNYNKVMSGIDAADARQQEALLAYRKSIAVALSDVEKSVTSLVKEQQHSAMLDDTVSQNRHAADIARERYKEGLSSFIEVLDAERTLYNSQSQATDSHALTVQDFIAVYKSLGGGWDDTQPAAPAKKT